MNRYPALIALLLSVVSILVSPGARAYGDGSSRPIALNHDAITADNAYLSAWMPQMEPPPDGPEFSVTELVSRMRRHDRDFRFYAEIIQLLEHDRHPNAMLALTRCVDGLWTPKFIADLAADALFGQSRTSDEVRRYLLQTVRFTQLSCIGALVRRSDPAAAPHLAKFVNDLLPHVDADLAHPDFSSNVLQVFSDAAVALAKFGNREGIDAVISRLHLISRSNPNSMLRPIAIAFSSKNFSPKYDQSTSGQNLAIAQCQTYWKEHREDAPLDADRLFPDPAHMEQRKVGTPVTLRDALVVGSLGHEPDPELVVARKAAWQLIEAAKQNDPDVLRRMAVDVEENETIRLSALGNYARVAPKRARALLLAWAKKSAGTPATDGNSDHAAGWAIEQLCRQGDNRCDGLAIRFFLAPATMHMGWRFTNYALQRPWQLRQAVAAFHRTRPLAQELILSRVFELAEGDPGYRSLFLRALRSSTTNLVVSAMRGLSAIDKQSFTRKDVRAVLNQRSAEPEFVSLFISREMADLRLYTPHQIVPLMEVLRTDFAVALRIGPVIAAYLKASVANGTWSEEEHALANTQIVEAEKLASGAFQKYVEFTNEVLAVAPSRGNQAHP